MPKASDLFRGSGDVPVGLACVQLRAEPVLLRFFADEFEEAKLHYVEDDAVRAYVNCPGAGCPLCHLGSAPQLTYVFAAYNIERRAVEALRVPAALGPGTLLSQLKPVFEDVDGAANRLVVLSKDGAKTVVRTRALAAGADRGERAIREFLDRKDAGLSLTSAFSSMTAQELAELPRVKLKLDALGDYACAAGETPRADD